MIDGYDQNRTVFLKAIDMSIGKFFIEALIKDSLETLQNGPIKVPLFTGNTGKFSKK